MSGCGLGGASDQLDAGCLVVCDGQVAHVRRLRPSPQPSPGGRGSKAKPPAAPISNPTARQNNQPDTITYDTEATQNVTAANPEKNQPRTTHGGPDAQGTAPHDFSTNGNACGPNQDVVAALREVDATHYPDPQYVALRERIAAFHKVVPERVVIAASASEFIFRISAAAARHGIRSVVLPTHSYGDYAKAAAAWGLETSSAGTDPALVWLCDPSSPLGQTDPQIGDKIDNLHPAAICVLDLAYEPLRLEGSLQLNAGQLSRVWQLWTPNKALGLTGIRAAYAIAPLDDEATAKRSASVPALMGTVTDLAPSWPVGAHGVALLDQWILPTTQSWLTQSIVVLRDWKAAQIAMCESLGWTPLPSTANFFCVRLAQRDERALATHLREAGIKFRNTASFGLFGHARLAVAKPASQQALENAMRTAPD